MTKQRPKAFGFAACQLMMTQIPSQVGHEQSEIAIYRSKRRITDEIRMREALCFHKSSHKARFLFDRQMIYDIII